MVGSREAYDRASSSDWTLGDLVDMVHEGYENAEQFSIMDATSADYAKRQMDKADAEFERDCGKSDNCEHASDYCGDDCPECGNTLTDGKCSNKARHQ
jgi:hypothetical protein